MIITSFSEHRVVNMKAAYLCVLLTLVMTSIQVLACPEWPECYLTGIYSAPPADINANGTLDENDRDFFVHAALYTSDPSDVLTCGQVAGIDIDKNGAIDTIDLHLFDVAVENSTPIPNARTSWGDVNEDGMLNHMDVIVYFGAPFDVNNNPTTVLSSIKPWGDVDGNGIIDLQDAVILKECLSDRIGKLPVIY